MTFVNDLLHSSSFLFYFNQEYRGGIERVKYERIQLLPGQVFHSMEECVLIELVWIEVSTKFLHLRLLKYFVHYLELLWCGKRVSNFDILSYSGWESYHLTCACRHLTHLSVLQGFMVSRWLSFRVTWGVLTEKFLEHGLGSQNILNGWFHSFSAIIIGHF